MRGRQRREPSNGVGQKLASLLPEMWEIVRLDAILQFSWCLGVLVAECEAESGHSNANIYCAIRHQGRHHRYRHLCRHCCYDHLCRHCCYHHVCRHCCRYRSLALAPLDPLCFRRRTLWHDVLDLLHSRG